MANLLLYMAKVMPLLNDPTANGLSPELSKVAEAGAVYWERGFPFSFRLTRSQFLAHRHELGLLPVTELWLSDCKPSQISAYRRNDDGRIIFTQEHVTFGEGFEVFDNEPASLRWDAGEVDQPASHSLPIDIIRLLIDRPDTLQVIYRHWGWEAHGRDNWHQYETNEAIADPESISVLYADQKSASKALTDALIESSRRAAAGPARINCLVK